MTEPQKSSGFFGALKGMIVETTPEKTPPSGSAAGKTDYSKVKLPPAFAKPIPAPTQPVYGSDPEVRKVLEHDVQEAAKPAYSEFNTINDSLVSILPDEKVRFQAVVATLTTRGQTFQQVLVDIDECLAALDKKASQATQASAKAKASRVDSKVQTAQNMMTQIDELHKQITKLQLDHDQLQDQIQTETKDIEETEVKFASTVEAYKAELFERRAKLISVSQGK